MQVKMNHRVYLTLRFLLCLLYHKTFCVSAVMVCMVAIPESSYSNPPLIALSPNDYNTLTDGQVINDMVRLILCESPSVSGVM